MIRSFSQLFFFFAFCCASLQAQSALDYQEEDQRLFEAMVDRLQSSAALQGPTSERLIALGKTFLGTPYVAKTLEQEGDEQVVLNLRGLDCTTYIENVLAFDRLFQNKQSALEEFGQQLEYIRYRDGQLQGYSSRLHYFTDWIRNNEQKGLVKNMTAALGGVEEERAINFMGTHPQYYPQLSAEAEVDKIRKTEETLSKEAFCYIPLDQIEGIEEQIASGDILALVTSIQGLDVTHTGFAIWQEEQLHLMHASTSGEVVISKKPLREYLKGIKKNIGILVVRPL